MVSWGKRSSGQSCLEDTIAEAEIQQYSIGLHEKMDVMGVEPSGYLSRHVHLLCFACFGCASVMIRCCHLLLSMI